MTLAIIIVSYNVRDELDRCLHSLHAPAPAVAHDILVVDNASADGSVGMVKTRWPDVRVIEAGGNLGFARANNLGIRATESDLILLLNSDTIAPPGAVDRLANALAAAPRAAVAGPRLLDANGRPELSFGAMIGPFTELGRSLLMRLYHSGSRLAERYVARATARARFTDWVSGACLLVWRKDAEAVRLLDERYFMYNEDVDFCAAIRARGRLVLFTPAAEVGHLRGRSVATAPDRVRVAYRESQLAFYRKHRPHWMPLLRLYLRATGKLPTQRPSDAPSSAC
ncbi:MAG: glycosyltransferase family 2 protein [Acidobacteria bacterium]|nr:glycosyltransferase family 2 protein [Acidobacteriota bacterium]